MRLAMIPAVLAASLGALSACGRQADNAGTERRSAAGEVLGGEIGDNMLPLDSVRSTSPAAPRAEARAASGAPSPAPDRGAVLPEPEVGGGPEPHTPSPPGVEPTDGPPPQ